MWGPRGLRDAFIVARFWSGKYLNLLLFRSHIFSCVALRKKMVRLFSRVRIKIDGYTRIRLPEFA